MGIICDTLKLLPKISEIIRLAHSKQALRQRRGVGIFGQRAAYVEIDIIYSLAQETTPAIAYQAP